MLNFGASKPRVGGGRAPGAPLDPHVKSVRIFLFKLINTPALMFNILAYSE